MESTTELSVTSTDVPRTWDGGKLRTLVAVTGGVVAFDFITKMIITRTFILYQQVNIIGEYVRLTYIHNPGAAFGISLGPYSRIIFLLLAVLAHHLPAVVAGGAGGTRGDVLGNLGERS
jgi:lipoprotein signal peptidase